MTALAILRKDDILQSLERGELMKNIAASLGITPGAISHALANDPRYQAARESGMATQLDNWQDKLENAEDAFNLARAREAFRAVSWRAEREYGGKWSTHSEVTHKGSAPSLTIVLSTQQMPESDGQVHENSALCQTLTAPSVLPDSNDAAAHDTCPATPVEGGDTSQG